MLMPDVARNVCFFGWLVLIRPNLELRIMMVVMIGLVGMFMCVGMFVRPRRHMDAAEKHGKRQKKHGDMTGH